MPYNLCFASKNDKEWNKEEELMRWEWEQDRRKKSDKDYRWNALECFPPFASRLLVQVHNKTTEGFLNDPNICQ